MKAIHPLISVIIPTYNEEKRIATCLESVINQKYPSKKIEIIVVDDKSTDNTVKIAKEYGAKILISGNKNIEMSKSIGLQKAKGEYIFLIDADITVLTNLWFFKAVNIFSNHPKLVAIQTYRYKYYKSDNIVNRYCSLFGINDPLAFYLGKRGQMMQTEQEWIYPSTLQKEYKGYYLCKFSTSNLPTIGSQGYMIKKYLLKKTHYKPYLFHMDSAYELVDKGCNQFAFIKEDIKHDYATGLSDMFKKLKRNADLFLELNSLRTFKYEINVTKILKATVIMITIVIPLIQALKNYIKIRDIAWFLHPLISFTVVIIYGFTFIKYKFKSSLNKFST